MRELEVARGIVAMLIVHLTRAGCHQVYLVNHIALYLKVHIRHLRIIAR